MITCFKNGSHNLTDNDLLYSYEQGNAIVGNACYLLVLFALWKGVYYASSIQVQETLCWNDISLSQAGIIITLVSEVIMFSPCVFVCLCVCVYVCHDVCPDDLTIKDWCHTNNILQVHCWGCLVVQVMFHALMTSLMTSLNHKIGQILKLIYLRQYLS